jgi:hypothetical protein
VCFPTVDHDGYGLISTWDPDTRRKSSHKASRYVWQQAFGPLPRWIEVCHSCDVRNCVRLSHLFLEDHAGNMRDAAEKQRMQHRVTWQTVLAIRASSDPPLVLARRYGLSAGYVYEVRIGKRRPHTPTQAGSSLI